MCSDFLSHKQWLFYNELIFGLHKVSFVCKILGNELRRSKDYLLAIHLETFVVSTSDNNLLCLMALAISTPQL